MIDYKDIENKLLKIQLNLSNKNSILISDLKTLFYLKNNREINTPLINSYIDNCFIIINEKTKIINEDISNTNSQKADEVLKFFLNPKILKENK